MLFDLTVCLIIDGTYDVDYLPKGSGDFVVDVKLGGAHIKDAPFKVKVVPGKGAQLRNHKQQKNQLVFFFRFCVVAIIVVLFFHLKTVSLLFTFPFSSLAIYLFSFELS